MSTLIKIWFSYCLISNYGLCQRIEAPCLTSMWYSLSSGGDVGEQRESTFHPVTSGEYSVIWSLWTGSVSAIKSVLRKWNHHLIRILGFDGAFASRLSVYVVQTLTIHNIIRVGIVGQLGHFDTPEDIVQFFVNNEEVISSVIII